MLKNAWMIAINFACITGVTSACVSSKEKKEMQDDIFTLKTRLMNVEREVTDTSKESKTTGDTAAKRLASNRAELEKLSQELQQVKGEIQALRIGVQTGRIPGADDSQGSVGATMDSLGERLTALESDQQDIMEAIKSAGSRRPKEKELRANDPKRSAGVSTVSALQNDFDGKRFSRVIDEAPRILKDSHGDDRDKVRFLHAESLFKMGRIREAALKYNEFIEAKPGKSYLPTVKMRLGDCFRHLGDAATARVYYEELVKEFPKSEEAGKAKERLADFDAKGSVKG